MDMTYSNNNNNNNKLSLSPPQLHSCAAAWPARATACPAAPRACGFYGGRDESRASPPRRLAAAAELIRRCRCAAQLAATAVQPAPHEWWRRCRVWTAGATAAAAAPPAAAAAE